MKSKITLLTTLLLVLVAFAVIFSAATKTSAEPGTGIVEVGPKGNALVFDNLSLYSTSEYGTYFDTVNHKPNGVEPEDGGEYSNELLHPYSVTPTTYEAWIKLPAGLSDMGGCILGNYKNSSTVNWDFRIETNGAPKLYHLNYYNSSTDKDLNNIAFNSVNVATGEFVHLVIVDDVAAGEFRCYVNGSLAQSITMTDAQKAHERKVPPISTVLGGDMRAGNLIYFKGEISSVTIYSDVRTPEEIALDMTSIDLNDSALIAHYDCEGKQGARVIPDLAGNYPMTHNRNNEEWVNTEQVEPLNDWDYSIALIGDQQIITGYNPDQLHYFGDWFLDNYKEQKLGYILNVGDMTNFNKDEEWPVIRDEYARYDGIIPYALVRGDHDILAKDRTSAGQSNEDGQNLKMFTDTFTGTAYADTIEGWCEDLTNSYRTATLGTRNTKYLIITIDKNASPEVRAWAKGVIEAHPDHRVIITTHCYLSCNGTHYRVGDESTTDPVSGRYKVNGDTLFNELVKPYDNVDFFISGHVYSRRVVWAKTVSDTGNVCNEINVNPQGPGLDREGTCGLVAMLYFSEDGEDVQVRYYSTVQDRYFSKVSQFSINTEDTADKVYATVEDREQGFTEAVFTAAKVTGVTTGQTASVPVTYTGAEGIERAVVKLSYDSSKLSFASASGNNVIAKSVDGAVYLTYDGAALSDSGTLGTVSFNATNVPDGDPALITPYVVSASRKLSGTTYELEGAKGENGLVGVSDAVRVEYNSGDDFKAKIEQALKSAESFDVEFVMNADYIASADAVFGSVDAIPAHKVTVTSGNTASPSLLHTGGFTLVFAGNFEFDNIKVGGAGTTGNNAFFFPNGASGKFGANISNLDTVVTTWNTTTYTGRPNAVGASVRVESGYWCVVAANVSQTAYSRAINDPVLVIAGTANVANAAGSQYLGSNSVTGSTDISVLDSAVIGRYIAAGIYATSNNVGNIGGKLYINTDGKVNTVAGCVVQKANTSSVAPEYEITIDNGAVSAVKGVHLISSATNAKIRYDVHITINGGTFSGLIIGGLQTGTANTGCTYLGSSVVEINGGTFSKDIYGGSYLFGSNGTIGADGEEQSSSLIINVGNDKTLSVGVYGGSNIGMTDSFVYQNSSLEIKSGNVEGVITGGCCGSGKAHAESIDSDGIYGGYGQIGNVDIKIGKNAGDLTGTVSLTGYNGVNAKGDSTVTIEGGTFSKDVYVLNSGSSASGSFKSTSVSGMLKVYIKGGTFNGSIIATATGATNFNGVNGYSVIGEHNYWEISGGTLPEFVYPNQNGSSRNDVYVKFVGGSDIDISKVSRLHVNRVNNGNQANTTHRRNVLDLTLVDDPDLYTFFTDPSSFTEHTVGATTWTAWFTVVYPPLYDLSSLTASGVTDASFARGELIPLASSTLNATFNSSVAQTTGSAGTAVSSVNSYTAPYSDLVAYDTYASCEEAKNANAIRLSSGKVSAFSSSVELIAGNTTVPLNVTTDGKAAADAMTLSDFAYLGASIRPSDYSLRVRAYVTSALRGLTLENDGYKVNRYGILLGRNMTAALTPDNARATALAYGEGTDVFYLDNGRYTFAAAITGIGSANYASKIMFRPFVEYIDEAGLTYVTYADLSGVENFLDAATGNINVSLRDVALYIRANDAVFYAQHKSKIDEIAG